MYATAWSIYVNITHPYHRQTKFNTKIESSKVLLMYV